MPTPIKLKRYTGSAYEILQPETTWSQVTDKPSTFTPTAHTHLSADITDLKSNLKYLYIYGKAQSAITKGQAVQFAGIQGDHILIKAAVPSEINANPDYFIGLAEATLATDDFGYVLTQGELVDVNTSTYTAGIIWFASAGSTAGALTATEPTGTNAKIQVGAVTKVNASSGIILTRMHIFGVHIADIIASGTPSATTFLSGNGTWATPADDTKLPLAGGTMTLSGGTLSNGIYFNTAQTYIGPRIRGSVQNLQRTYYTDSYTIWDAGNDGPGSGLDADTVDGIEASSFPIAVKAVKTTSTSAGSGVTPVSAITFSLDANSNYAININGMWSKSYGGAGSFGTVVSIAVDNATGTPTWNGVYEWAASPSATSLTIESESANITTSTTAHGWTAGVSTASVSASFFRINGRIFTGTTTKTLTLYVAKSADQTGSAVINSANGVAIKL